MNPDQWQEPCADCKHVLAQHPPDGPCSRCSCPGWRPSARHQTGVVVTSGDWWNEAIESISKAVPDGTPEKVLVALLPGVLAEATRRIEATYFSVTDDHEPDARTLDNALAVLAGLAGEAGTP